MEKDWHWRKGRDCVRFAKNTWHEADTKSVESVSSKGWTKGVGSTGESGTEGAVVGSVVVGVAERLDEPLSADAVLLAEFWVDAVLPMPPRESTGASTPSTVCLRTSVGACMSSGILR